MPVLRFTAPAIATPQTVAAERRDCKIRPTFIMVDNTGIRGTHTAVLHATIMTDAAAAFVVNQLVGLTILNVTDGSSGIITANTVNTVTVAALAGGTTNQWNTNDIYSVVSHPYDVSTGVPLPYTVPQGYTYTMFQKDWTANQDLEIWAYFDGILAGCPGISPSGANIYFNSVVPYSTVTLDPTGALAHTIDLHIKNVGTDVLEGGFDFVGILEAVGTPALPTVKECQCPFCNHRQIVPVGTTNIICDKCGKLYFVQDLSRIRQF